MSFQKRKGIDLRRVSFGDFPVDKLDAEDKMCIDSMLAPADYATLSYLNQACGDYPKCDHDFVPVTGDVSFTSLGRLSMKVQLYVRGEKVDKVYSSPNASTPIITHAMMRNLSYVQHDKYSVSVVTLTGDGANVIDYVRQKYDGFLVQYEYVCCGDRVYKYSTSAYCISFLGEGSNSPNPLNIPCAEIVNSQAYLISGDVSLIEHMGKEFSAFKNPKMSFSALTLQNTIPIDGIIVSIRGVEYKLKKDWTIELAVLRVHTDGSVCDLGTYTSSIGLCVYPSLTVANVVVRPYKYKEGDIVEYSLGLKEIVRLRSDRKSPQTRNHLIAMTNLYTFRDIHQLVSFRPFIQSCEFSAKLLIAPSAIAIGRFPITPGAMVECNKYRQRYRADQCAALRFNGTDDEELNLAFLDFLGKCDIGVRRPVKQWDRIVEWLFQRGLCFLDVTLTSVLHACGYIRVGDKVFFNNAEYEERVRNSDFDLRALLGHGRILKAFFKSRTVPQIIAKFGHVDSITQVFRFWCCIKGKCSQMDNCIYAHSVDSIVAINSCCPDTGLAAIGRTQIAVKDADVQQVHAAPHELLELFDLLK